MRVLVCGGRDMEDASLVRNALDTIHMSGAITCIIHGGAQGADRIGAAWARFRGPGVRVAHYAADWGRYGRGAGPKRNQQMLNEGRPDLVVAFWDGSSRGTHDMIKRAVKAGVPVRIFPYTSIKSVGE